MLESKKIFPKGSKKLINAWAFYDWANSVYSLVISSAIFPIYYAASPLLSGIADFVGNKKNFMQFFVYLGSISCVGLYWFDLDNLYLGLLFYFLAMIGIWASLVFYNSYLPDVAYPEQQDRASARGFSMGYIGSVLLLLFNLSMVMMPEAYGIEGSAGEAAMQAMRYSFVSVGIWWLGFSQVSFYFLPKGNKNDEKVTRDIFWNGFRELRNGFLYLFISCTNGDVSCGLFW